jgi:hypothetical protein
MYMRDGFERQRRIDARDLRAARRLASALELAVRQAVGTGEDCVSVEGLLSGLLEADESRIAAVLAPLGVTPDAISDALDEV